MASRWLETSRTVQVFDSLLAMAGSDIESDRQGFPPTVYLKMNCLSAQPVAEVQLNLPIAIFL